MTYRPTPGFALTLIVSALAFALLLTACGGGGSSDPECTPRGELPPDTSARPDDPCRDHAL